MTDKVLQPDQVRGHCTSCGEPGLIEVKNYINYNQFNQKEYSIRGFKQCATPRCSAPRLFISDHKIKVIKDGFGEDFKY